MNDVRWIGLVVFGYVALLLAYFALRPGVMRR